MKRSFSIVVLSLLGIVVAPFPSAWSQADDFDPDIYAAAAESSAIQVVADIPMRLEPSIGYAQSMTNQEPNSVGRASVVEPGLVGRMAAYTYFQIIDIPLSSECAYPDPPGPQQRSQSATQQPPSTEKQPKDADTGGAIAICRSDNRPSNYSHASVAEGVAGNLSVRHLAATSSTERLRDQGLVVSKSAATLRGVTIADVLSIDEITSSVSAKSGRAPGSEAATAGVAIAGATVQGQRVAITESGVVVKDPLPGTSLADAQKQVDEALASAAVSLRLLRASHIQNAEPGKAVAYSGGVLVSWKNEKAEKAFTVVLGQSRASAVHHRSDSDASSGAESSASAPGTTPYATTGLPPAVVRRFDSPQ
jgi:hypothetical protein